MLEQKQRGIPSIRQDDYGETIRIELTLRGTSYPEARLILAEIWDVSPEQVTEQDIYAAKHPIVNQPTGGLKHETPKELTE